MTFEAYDGGGFNAIKPKKRGRKARARDHTLLVDHDPAQLKLKGCMWTRGSVKELIKQKYGIAMPNRTVGEYLHRWGFTVQRPAMREVNQKRSR